MPQSMAVDFVAAISMAAAAASTVAIQVAVIRAAVMEAGSATAADPAHDATRRRPTVDR